MYFMFVDKLNFDGVLGKDFAELCDVYANNMSRSPTSRLTRRGN